MRRLLAFILGLIVGAPVGAFFWYAYSPLLFDEIVFENLSEAEVVAAGSFRDADDRHKGQGIVTLVARPDGQHEIQLSKFQVTNGPDLEVWLSTHPDPQVSSDVAGSPWVSLGQLKGNVGDQAYPVPDGADLGAIKSVVIWCEQFSVLFSSAVLAPGG